MDVKKIIFIALICFLSASCLTGNLQEDEDAAPSKEEIELRINAGDTKDYCELYEWYGDGKCDTFCTRSDSDCASNCDSADAAPLVCPEGSVGVETCEGHPSCQELEACGATIYCETCESDVDQITWHIVGSEICPTNYFPLATCDSGVDNPCIELESGCGVTIYCNPKPTVECFSPICEDGFIEVERCKLADANCEDVVVCSKTGSCIPDQACDDGVVCKDDEIRYESREACELAGACRQDYVCTDIAWCGEAANCQAPDCGDKTSVLECTDAANCSEEFGCGQRALCEG